MIQISSQMTRKNYNNSNLNTWFRVRIFENGLNSRRLFSVRETMRSGKFHTDDVISLQRFVCVVSGSDWLFLGFEFPHVSNNQPRHYTDLCKATWSVSREGIEELSTQRETSVFSGYENAFYSCIPNSVLSLQLNWRKEDKTVTYRCLSVAIALFTVNLWYLHNNTVEHRSEAISGTSCKTSCFSWAPSTFLV